MALLSISLPEDVCLFIRTQRFNNKKLLSRKKKVISAVIFPERTLQTPQG